MRRSDDRRSARLALLLLPACLAALVALVLSALQDPVYEATSRVVIGARVVVETDEGTTVSDAVPLSAEIDLAEGDAVRRLVQEDLALSEPPSPADARPVNDGAGLEIAVRSATGPDAARFADAYADAYVTVRTEQALAALESASADARERSDALRAELEALADDEAATDELTAALEATASLRERLVDDTVVSVGSTNVVERAAVPESPADPNPPRDVLVAAVGGLLVGLLAVLVLDYRDDVILTRRDVERKLGLTVLGELRSTGGGDGRGPVVEELDLRPSTEVLGSIVTRAPGLRALGVVPGGASVDAASVAAGLALAASNAGYKVALIDADFTDRRIGELFDLPDERGLADVVGGVQPAEVRHVRDGVAVYGSGTSDDAGAATFLNPRFARLVNAMSDHYDLVILVEPSLSHDHVGPAPYVDASLVAVPEGSAGREVAAGVRRLRRAGGSVAGAIFLTAADEGHTAADSADVVDPVSIETDPAPDDLDGSSPEGPTRSAVGTTEAAADEPAG